MALAASRPAPSSRAAEAMASRPFRVRKVTREIHDTVTLELEPAERAGFAFAPGQFNMLYLFGQGEAAISISGDPIKPQVLTHTVRAVGALTTAFCQLRPGQTLGVRGPFGSAWPMDVAAGGDVLVIGGGIGMAPLRPIIYHLFAHRNKYGRAALLYGARTPDDLLYKRELAEWRGRFDVQIEVTVDAAEPEAWRGHVGVVPTMIARAEFDPEMATAFICGPEVMIRFTVADLQKRGLPLERIYVSMERNMRCAIGFCGHCQFGPTFICKDGPVFRYDQVAPLLRVREL